MTTIQLAQADAIADAVLAHGRSLKFQPLTVAILDAGGHLVVLKRDDQSRPERPGGHWDWVLVAANSRAEPSASQRFSPP